MSLADHHKICGEEFIFDVSMPIARARKSVEMSGLRLLEGCETVTRYSSTESNQKVIIPVPRLWLRRVIEKINTIFGQGPRQSTLPRHNKHSSTATQATQEARITPPKLVHLLACIRSAQLGKSLYQGCIDTIKTDRQLFAFLRELYKSKRGRICTLLSLKAVKGIHFVRLNLFAGGTVEVRHHKECCKQDCLCIPPASLVEPSDKAEYQCKPAGPLELGPPILPDVLAHFYTSPSCISERTSSVLNRLPKRICGELQEPLDDPAEGWGIYFQEGWDGDIIVLLVFAMFFTVSLVFGILWSCLKMDVQGAFGVSAYLLTAGAVLISLVATRANKI